jgi:intein/homing endonuclease
MLTQSKNVFKLSEKFLTAFEGKQPNWGPLGYITYKRTYARMINEETEETEEFWQTCKRVVEGVYNIQRAHCEKLRLPWNAHKSQKSAQTMFSKMWNFKFLPPGRGLWMMGNSYIWKHGSAALNNCFDGDTEIFIEDLKGGIHLSRLRDLDGRKVNIIVNNSGDSKEAIINNFGRQTLYDITLKPRGLRSNYELKYRATKNHRWILSNGESTTNLKKGDVLHSSSCSISHDYEENQDSDHWKRGFCHGLIFGDGTRHTYYPNRHFIRLCGEKEQVHKDILAEMEEYKSTTYPKSFDGDAVVTLVLDNENWKALPENKNPVYIQGFLDGWIAADAHTKINKSETICLDTTNSEAAEWVCKWGPICGYSVTGWSVNKDATNFGPRNKPLNRISLQEGYVDYTVVSIEEAYDDDVYCATVPGLNEFLLPGGIVTGNCAFVSTKELSTDFSAPFVFLMDMSMLGVGVGGDCKGEGIVNIKPPKMTSAEWVIPDTREGWVESVKILLDAFVGRGSVPIFNYSKVRQFGARIRGFGGTASGPGPLMDLHVNIVKVLTNNFSIHFNTDHDEDGRLQTLSFPSINFETHEITSTQIVDIFNYIGKCVVAGNVRRTAEIMFGDPNDEAFIALKADEEALTDRRWASNNSIYAEVGMDYTKFAEMTALNGEPGYMWLDNARKYSRMCDPEDWKDRRAEGANPCVTGDTWVATNHGYKQVKYLVGLEDLNLLVNGKYHKALSKGFWHTGKKDIFELTTVEGYSLKLTSNHKVLTNKRGWVESKDLQFGDEIVLNNHRKSIIYSETTIEHKEGFLMGLLVGDGTFADNNAIISLWDSELCDELIDSASHMKKRSDWKGFGFIEDRSELRLKLAAITELALKFGITQGNKIITDEIMGASLQTIRGFLRGLFEADGAVIGSQDKGLSVRLSQSNYKLLQNAQQLLLRLGIKSSIYKNRREAGEYPLPDGQGGRKMYVCKAMHELVISNEDLFEFNSLIGFASKTKNSKLEKSLNSYKRRPNKTKFYSRFDNLRYIGQEDVYDVTVEEVHAFDANGLYVHNCVEQTLESFELCCLVETFPYKHDTLEEYLETLKFAYLYAKTVTLLPTHDERTNAVMMRNRRIGCSQSGIQNNIAKIGFREHMEWCKDGFERIKSLDKIYSDWLCVPRSIKRTSVKPSGTVSLLPGASPGVHFEHSEYYLRRIRIQRGSYIVQACLDSGYDIEPCPYQPDSMVVSFPVHVENFEKSKDDASLWEQLEIVAQMQSYWADNQVSATVTFRKDEAKDIATALKMYETRLKSISFLPLSDHGYKLAPYETITKSEFENYSARLLPLDLSQSTHEVEDKFCDGDKCSVPFPSPEK